VVILVDPRRKKITAAAEGRMPNGGSMAELQVLHRHVDSAGIPASVRATVVRCIWCCDGCVSVTGDDGDVGIVMLMWGLCFFSACI